MKTLAWVSLCIAVGASAHPSAKERQELLGQLIEAHPEQQQLYVKRGATYSNEGQYELALADLLKAESLGEAHLAAFELGVLHHRMGSFDLARSHFDTYLEHFPNHALSLEHRARMLRDAGDYEASLADFRAYFELREQPNPGNYISVAKMLSEKKEGIEAALGMLDEGMERLGVIPHLQDYAIDLELRRKNVAAAIHRLQSLEGMLGESPDWCVDMGELLLLADRAPEAHALFQLASARLDDLRSTPARRRLRERLRILRAGLES